MTETSAIDIRQPWSNGGPFNSSDAQNVPNPSPQENWQSFPNISESPTVALIGRRISFGYSSGVTPPLLHVQPSSDVESRDITTPTCTHSSESSWETLAIEEGIHLTRIALPLASTNLCSFGISIISIAFLGRLGARELAISILATSLFNVTGLSVVQGLNAALETFCGQAWGAGNYPAVGIVLQRALLVNSALTVVVSLLWSTSTASMLRLLGQDPDLANASAQYLTLLAPGLWFAAVFEALKRYLAIQGEVRAGAIVTAVALALCPLYNWVLIYPAGMGLHGAALALVAVEITMAAGLAWYCVVLERKRAAGIEDSTRRTWLGWSRESLTGWGQFMKHGVPSTIMLCAEWWTFECLVILSGRLPNPDTSLAVMGISLNMSSLIWSTISGLGLACSARVASTLGAGMPSTARRAAMVSLAMAVALEVVVAGVILLTKNSLGYAFTSSESLVAVVASLMPIFALSLPGDGANAVLQGLLRGAGRQSTGALTNLCSFWLVGIPISYYLGFTCGYGLKGLWGGIAIVMTFQGFVMLAIALSIDFVAESKKALQRSATLVEPLLAEEEVVGVTEE